MPLAGQAGVQGLDHPLPAVGEGVQAQISRWPTSAEALGDGLGGLDAGQAAFKAVWGDEDYARLRSVLAAWGV